MEILARSPLNEISSDICTQRGRFVNVPTENSHAHFLSWQPGISHGNTYFERLANLTASARLASVVFQRAIANPYRVITDESSRLRSSRPEAKNTHSDRRCREAGAGIPGVKPPTQLSHRYGA